MLKPTARIFMGTLAALVLLVGCRTKPEGVLPTKFELDTSASSPAAQTTNTPQPTTTRSVPTLPSTFTPTLEPSPTPTDPADEPTITPIGFSASGFIYYIFNGDSLAALAGDGSSESLVALGGPFSDLTISPDGKLLTYVAPGSGSAREVYVTSRDGSYTQKITCLGFANVSQPTWRPDGKAIAFLAAPVSGGALDIYIADLAGANACPQGNNQHQLVRLGSNRARDLTWNPTGDKLFFSDLYVFGFDIPTGKPYPLSQPSGFGADFGLAHSPIKPVLAYLRTAKDPQSGLSGGELVQIDTTNITQQPAQQAGLRLFVQQIRWSSDGRFVLIGTVNTVFTYDTQSGSSFQVTTNLKFPPQPAFNPDASLIAYLDADPNNPALQQIWVVKRLGGDSQRITSHEEGTITNLIWLPG